MQLEQELKFRTQLDAKKLGIVTVEKEKKAEPIPKASMEEHDKWKAMMASLAMAGTYYASQLSDAWVDMMMGVKVAWDELIKSMIANLIKSGLYNLIANLFSGGTVSLAGLLGFQHGISYVPKTGAYILHRGEAVVPAHRNVSYVRNYNQGGNTTNYNVLYLDPEKLTRRSIVPMIEKMAMNRQTRLVMG